MTYPYCKEHGFVKEESCYAHIHKNTDCEMSYKEKEQQEK